MSAIVLLSVVLAGQCGPRGCSEASMTPGPASQVEGRDYYVVKRYRVTHNGVTFEVEGYLRPDTGQVTWEPVREFNRLSYAAAVARQLIAGISTTGGWPGDPEFRSRSRAHDAPPRTPTAPRVPRLAGSSQRPRRCPTSARSITSR